MHGDNIDRALDRLTHGVYLIGTGAGKRRNAMTAAWVTQASGRPPIVLVAVGKTHYTSELIPEAGAFSLNVLSADQYELARKCGFGTGRYTDRLAGLETVTKATGAPVLAECAAYLDCELVSQFPIGDHIVFAGQVVDAGSTDAPVMVYRSADFF